MHGHKYSLNNENPKELYWNPFKDSWSDKAEQIAGGAGDIASDIYHTAEDAVEDIYHEVVQPALDITIDFLYYELDMALDIIDYGFEAVGVSGSTKFLDNINTAARYIGHGIADGNWEAIKAGAMVAVAIVITWYTWDPYVFANAIGSVIALSETAAIALIAAGYVAAIYSIYGISLSLAMIGNYINNPSRLAAIASRARDAMNIAFTNAWINGSMNMWMAGGILYDSPKAGDLLFNVTGDLNTTKFLNAENKNTTTWSNWNNGKYHEFERKVFGNMAGDEFFSISPIAQRI